MSLNKNEIINKILLAGIVTEDCVIGGIKFTLKTIPEGILANIYKKHEKAAEDVLAMSQFKKEILAHAIYKIDDELFSKVGDFEARCKILNETSTQLNNALFDVYNHVVEKANKVMSQSTDQLLGTSKKKKESSSENTEEKTNEEISEVLTENKKDKTPEPGISLEKSQNPEASKSITPPKENEDSPAKEGVLEIDPLSSLNGES